MPYTAGSNTARSLTFCNQVHARVTASRISPRVPQSSRCVARMPPRPHLPSPFAHYPNSCVRFRPVTTERGWHTRLWCLWLWTYSTSTCRNPISSLMSRTARSRRKTCSRPRRKGRSRENGKVVSGGQGRQCCSAIYILIQMERKSRNVYEP